MKPTLFCLHGLGLSSRHFDLLAMRLANDFDVVALDLPGFGDNSPASGTSVEEMCAFAIRKIRAHLAGVSGRTDSDTDPRWMLLGHSMGGKIATIVASRTLSGDAPLFGLAGLVLLAASPCFPEPIDPSRREEMLGWAADGPIDDAAAREFVDGNVGAPLEASVDAQTIGDVRRSSPEAWVAWLDRGSREDWTAAVGELNLPAVIVSGGSDGDLGPDAQRRLNGPVYPDAAFVTLDGAGHLLAIERPDEVAALVSRFWVERAGTGPIVPSDIAQLIASPRTSARTRGILSRRSLADEPRYQPRVLDRHQLTTLRSVAEIVVPQSGPSIDLAARLDRQLAAGGGDGWRNALLPVDSDAYRRALDTLAGFSDLTVEKKRTIVTDLAAGDYQRSVDARAESEYLLDAGQLAAWFEDARVDLVRIWLAHPSTMARIGFDGFANGGDGIRKQGFELLAAGSRESWEPRMEGVR